MLQQRSCLSAVQSAPRSLQSPLTLGSAARPPLSAAAAVPQPGKSLYTTIREFVENSLDAAESIGERPDIDLRVEKLSTAEFNRLRGLEHHTRADHALYEQAKPAKVSGHV